MLTALITGAFQMVASQLVSASNFFEIVETAARLQRQAREVVNRAGLACLVARQFEDRSRTARAQREDWAAVLAGIPLDPAHLVVLCAGCHRVQAPRGWRILPAGVEDRLMIWDRALVSHGFCPDCLRSQSLTGWPAVEATAAS